MGKIEEQRVAANGKQVARPAENSGKHERERRPKPCRHPGVPAPFQVLAYRLHVSVLLQAEAGSAASRGTGCSTMGQWISAAKTPSPTEIHHMVS